MININTGKKKFIRDFSKFLFLSFYCIKRLQELDCWTLHFMAGPKFLRWLKCLNILFNLKLSFITLHLLKLPHFIFSCSNNSNLVLFNFYPLCYLKKSANWRSIELKLYVVPQIITIPILQEWITIKNLLVLTSSPPKWTNLYLKTLLKSEKQKFR